MGLTLRAPASAQKPGARIASSFSMVRIVVKALRCACGARGAVAKAMKASLRNPYSSALAYDVDRYKYRYKYCDGNGVLDVGK